jgi:GT2 family glycosyltransferase
MFDVVIVIVNYNMKEQLERCLSSLFLDISDSGLKIRVVVVDNSSTDGSLSMLTESFPQVDKVLLNENKGFGAAQNIGLKLLKSKYFFVLNPDTYFFENEMTVKKMFDCMEKETNIGMIGPKIIYPDGSLQLSCCRFPTVLHPLFTRMRIGSKKVKSYQKYLYMKDVEHDQFMPVDWLIGAAMFIRSTALDKVGYFDERFWMYYEDSDLCRRFWEKNLPVYYFPDTKLEHVHNRGSADEPNVLKALLKNKLARVHVMSWLKYMWKWRGNLKYYIDKI